MDKKEVFKQYMSENEILIVDKNPVSRNRLLKTVYDLGVSSSLIHSTGKLSEAEDFIKNKNIGIVLSDYFINGGSGFDLFNKVREKNPNSKKLCFILVTSNISQAAVAKAAEEDVDSFIIKPYTIQSLQESLISTIYQKIKPSPYIVKVEEGKELMLSGELDQSMSVFKEALGLHAKPSLAHYYIGQLETLIQNLDKAENSYAEGLNFNSIHYKCMVGLFELFMRKDRYNDAYKIVKKISKFFPANPDRLAQVVRLAVMTNNFEDIPTYYELFLALDERAHNLVNYIGSGMFVAGKFFLMNNRQADGLKCFEAVAVSTAGGGKFLRGIVETLVDHDLIDQAEAYLSRFMAGERETKDFLVADFLITSKKQQDPNFVVKLGLDLYNKQIKEFSSMKKLIKAMEESGYGDDKVLPFKSELSQLYPDKAA